MAIDASGARRQRDEDRRGRIEGCLRRLGDATDDVAAKSALQDLMSHAMEDVYRLARRMLDQHEDLRGRISTKTLVGGTANSYVPGQLAAAEASARNQGQAPPAMAPVSPDVGRQPDARSWFDCRNGVLTRFWRWVQAHRPATRKDFLAMVMRCVTFEIADWQRRLFGRPDIRRIVERGSHLTRREVADVLFKFQELARAHSKSAWSRARHGRIPEELEPELDALIDSAAGSEPIVPPTVAGRKALGRIRNSVDEWFREFHPSRIGDETVGADADEGDDLPDMEECRAAAAELVESGVPEEYRPLLLMSARYLKRRAIVRLFRKLECDAITPHEASLLSEFLVPARLKDRLASLLAESADPSEESPGLTEAQLDARVKKLQRVLDQVLALVFLNVAQLLKRTECRDLAEMLYVRGITEAVAREELGLDQTAYRRLHKRMLREFRGAIIEWLQEKPSPQGHHVLPMPPPPC